MTRTCKYKPCGNAFEPTDSRHEYCGPTCRANQHYADHPAKGRSVPAVPLQSVATHGLDEVRAQAEASNEKSRWTLVAREHLTRTLLKTGYFSSEDFDALGIPAEHVNVGNSQMGIFSKKGFMDPISWRRSSKPSRKSGKIWTYRITEKGRRELSKLVGVGAGFPSSKGADDLPRSEVRSSVDPGETPSVGLPSGISQPAEGSARSEGEPLQFDIAEPSRYRDHDQPRAA